MKKPAKARPSKKPDNMVLYPPPRKRPPKDNLGDVPALLRKLGPNFYVPGRPLPKSRRPDSTIIPPGVEFVDLK